MPDLNIFKLDFGNLAKLISKGRVDKVYYKMYQVADRLSREEFEVFRLELLGTLVKEGYPKASELIIKLTDFKKDRITFHMNEMKQLLEMSLKAQSEKNNRKD